MTETRKKIIELISDFMDKTLSDGCLVGTGITRDIIWKIIGEEHNHYSNQYKIVNLLNTRDNVIIKGEIKNHRYIYGHYDITAVLRYIGNTKIYLFADGSEYFHFNLRDGTKCFRIPNKPLHLYTEEEDKQLLALLDEIKND